MELVSRKKLASAFDRYKYALIVVLIGVALMLMPISDQKSAKTESEIKFINTNLQAQLEDILSCIDGAGEVRVLLTEETGSSTIYQTDTDRESDPNGTSEHINTVLITTSDRNEEGLVLRRDPPIYQGAIIVCKGASSPQVRLAIMEAVSCATGLSSHQISIVKME